VNIMAKNKKNLERMSGRVREFVKQLKRATLPQ